MQWPNRVWYQTSNGWASKPPTQADIRRRLKVNKLFSGNFVDEFVKLEYLIGEK